MDTPKFNPGDKVLIYRDSHPTDGSEKFVGEVAIIVRLNRPYKSTLGYVTGFSYDLNITDRWWFFERDLKLLLTDPGIKCRNKLIS